MNADPTRLDTLIDFLASRDRVDAVIDDHFESGARFAAWLASRDVPLDPGTVTDDDARNARRLRAALISFLRDADAAHRTIATIDGVTAIAPLQLRAGPDGDISLHAAAGGVPGFLAGLLVDLYDAHVEGTAGRLKICPAEDCVRAFYDRSKNRSRVWCDMSTCGTTHKVRAYRDRQRAEVRSEK